MKTDFLELTPVQYGASSSKTLHSNFNSYASCFRLHWHDRMELLYIKKGSIYIEHGTEFIKASAGDLIIIPPKTLHKGYTRDDSVEYDVLMFDIRSFYNETEICKSLLPAIFDGTAVLRKVTSNLETVCCMNSICNNDALETLGTISKIYQLLNILCQNELLEVRSQPRNAIVKKMIDYLEEHVTQEINIPMLCKLFGYTESHLCRKFKESTGLAPMKYLMIYRLELACKIIKTSDKSISDIALECGFSDANYFTRCFKKHFGIPPIQYRKL